MLSLCQPSNPCPLLKHMIETILITVLPVVFVLLAAYLFMITFTSWAGSKCKKCGSWNKWNHYHESEVNGCAYTACNTYCHNPKCGHLEHP